MLLIVINFKHVQINKYKSICVVNMRIIYLKVCYIFSMSEIFHKLGLDSICQNIGHLILFALRIKA